MNLSARRASVNRILALLIGTEDNFYSSITLEAVHELLSTNGGNGFLETKEVSTVGVKVPVDHPIFDE